MTQSTTTDADIDLSDVLRRTSDCVSQLTSMILRVEEHLFSGVTATQKPELQTIDYIKQSSEDIAEVLRRLAEVVPAAASVSHAALLDGIKLQDVRNAIGQGEPAPHANTVNRDIDIF